MNPTLSVIVPVHNEEAALPGTLECLLAQEGPREEREILVALNGCTDGSRAVAQSYPVRVVESDRSGMSFGKNLGARAARGGVLVFVDADTTLPANALARIAAAVGAYPKTVVALPGRPERGGPVVRLGFRLANLYARRRRVLSPGPVMAMQRAVFEEIGGLDESLPQGTSSDLIMRARAAGARYVFLDGVYAVTSIRRFEKKGIVRQLLEWRRNHRDLVRGRRTEVGGRPYDVIR